MSIWQTKKWGEMLEKSGQVEKIINSQGLFIEKRKISLSEYGLFIIGLKKEQEINENYLIEIAKKENALFIQIENLDYKQDLNRNLKIFKTGYYKKFITPHTIVINLNLSEDQMLASMKPKGRYNIKLAIKKGVKCEIVEKSERNIKDFYDILIETTSRDGFNGNNISYYKDFLNILENSKLILAKKDEKVIAGGIFTFDKDISIYYYGASTSNNTYRNLMAPYLIQWTAIKYAKTIGSSIYDFLGVSSDLKNKKDPLSGVSDFKLKLSSDYRKVSVSYIFINKKFKFRLIFILKSIKKCFFLKK